MNGQPALHNVMGLFEHVHDAGHRLVMHEWTPRDKFLELCSTMDIGMQVSFSETFNIVGADMISQGVPIVCSSEVPWYEPRFIADPTSSDDILTALHATYEIPQTNVRAYQANLTKYTNTSKLIWMNYFYSEA